jgi:hypothetical protein
MALEELFPGKRFIKTRAPTWLEGLELDCYNGELRLAFEYQGVQHYEFVPFFHEGDPERLEKQKQRDRRKREMCFEQWVTLVEVPYTVPLTKLRSHVEMNVKDLGYDTAPVVLSDLDFLAKVRTEEALAATMLKKAHEVASSHGGRCLSTTYLNCHHLLEFECRAGHRFETGLASVNFADHQRPRFCPECGGTRRRTDEEDHLLAESCGYTLVGTRTRRVGKAQRADRVLDLVCPNGHEYSTSRANFAPVTDGKPKRGCIRCARTRTNQERGVREREERAKLFGLKPTGPFVPRTEPADWECLYCGHTFSASWTAILNRGHKKCFRC